MLSQLQTPLTLKSDIICKQLHKWLHKHLQIPNSLILTVHKALFTISQKTKSLNFHEQQSVRKKIHLNKINKKLL